MTEDKTPAESGLEIGDAPRCYWDDFGRQDWEWVAKTILQDRFGQKLTTLRKVFDGKVAEQLKADFARDGVNFELDDLAVQESIWGPFFEALESVVEFERKVRRFHRRRHSSKAK